METPQSLSIMHGHLTSEEEGWKIPLFVPALELDPRRCWRVQEPPFPAGLSAKAPNPH